MEWLRNTTFDKSPGSRGWFVVVLLYPDDDVRSGGCRVVWATLEAGQKRRKTKVGDDCTTVYLIKWRILVLRLKIKVWPHWTRWLLNLETSCTPYLGGKRASSLTVRWPSLSSSASVGSGSLIVCLIQCTSATKKTPSPEWGFQHWRSRTVKA